MRLVTFSSLRNGLAAHLDKVQSDSEEMIVTRRGKNPVVVMLLSDWEGMKERISSSASDRRAMLE